MSDWITNNNAFFLLSCLPSFSSFLPSFLLLPPPLRHRVRKYESCWLDNHFTFIFISVSVFIVYGYRYILNTLYSKMLLLNLQHDSIKKDNFSPKSNAYPLLSQGLIFLGHFRCLCKKGLFIYICENIVVGLMNTQLILIPFLRATHFQGKHS